MKILKVRPDISKYQSIGLVDEDLWATDKLTFDCSAKNDWEPVKCYVQNPKLRRGNFFHLCPGLLVCDQKALEGMEDIFEMAGEVLSLELENGSRLFGINVLECVNAIDVENTEWRVSSSGVKTGIVRHVFHPNRFTESTLFKVPETSRGELLSYAELKDENDEFKGRYKDLGLAGLVFEELWQAPAEGEKGDKSIC